MKLADYLRDTRTGISELARQIGKPRQTARRYATGERLPERRTMVRIYVWSKGAVQPNDFYELPELEARLPEPCGGQAPAEAAA